MAKIKFCSVCGSKVAESDQFCGSCGTKRLNLQKDDRIEVTATTKSLKDFLQEKRKGRQKFSLPRKSLGCHKIRSDAKPSHKIVDTSVIIEVGIMDMSKGIMDMSKGIMDMSKGIMDMSKGIMDMSKGNLEPVRGSRLPVKVGKDMNQEEICQLTIKKHCDHDQFFTNLEQYVLLYPDKKLVYQVPGTTEMFTLAKYKSELGKPFSKLTLFLCKEKDFQSSLLTGFDDEVHILIFNIFSCKNKYFLENNVLQNSKCELNQTLQNPGSIPVKMFVSRQFSDVFYLLENEFLHCYPCSTIL